MSRSNCLGLSMLLTCCLFAACTSSPEKPAIHAEKAPAAKPKFDFGTATLSPNSGAGKEATFRISVSGGSQKPVFLGILINEKKDGAHACYVMRNFGANDIRLVADSGSGVVEAGVRRPVANKQCEIVPEATTSGGDAGGVTATFHLRFSPAFAGTKQIWGLIADAESNGPDLMALGSWTVQ